MLLRAAVLLVSVAHAHRVGVAPIRRPARAGMLAAAARDEDRRSDAIRREGLAFCLGATSTAALVTAASLPPAVRDADLIVVDVDAHTPLSLEILVRQDGVDGEAQLRNGGEDDLLVDALENLHRK